MTSIIYTQDLGSALQEMITVRRLSPSMMEQRLGLSKQAMNNTYDRLLEVQDRCSNSTRLKERYMSLFRFSESTCHKFLFTILS